MYRGRESGPSALPRPATGSYREAMSDGSASEQLDEMPELRLAAEHDRLAGLVSALEHEGLDVEPESTSIGELAAASQHPADLGSETFDRERDLSLLNEVRAELDANEDAADRLATGRYGWCEDCHRPIDLARLAAVPATSRCKACQDRFELDSLLTDGPDGQLSMEPDDLGEYLPDDEAERPAVLEPEEAALHVEG